MLLNAILSRLVELRAARPTPARPRRDVRWAPMPPEDGPLGHVQSLRRPNRLRSLLTWQRSLGDIVRVRTGHMIGHIVNRPDHARHVLHTQGQNYTKNVRGTHKLKLILGDGLLTSQGEEWRQQRHRAQPFFSRDKLTPYIPVFWRAAEETAVKWREAARTGEPIDLVASMNDLSLACVSDFMLGSRPGRALSRIARTVDILADWLNRHMESVLAPPLWVRSADNRRYRAALDELDTIVGEILDARRGDSKDDLVGAILRAHPQGIDERVQDEVLTFYLAGHETTGNALIWSWVLLAQHPEVDRAFGEAIDQELTAEPTSMREVDAMQFTNRVLREAMRLYPPVWMIGRSPTEDDTLDGFHIPAGSTVYLSPWLMHRHPDLWPDPERFDPSRFLELERIPKFGYLPFGIGRRACIGQVMAQVESAIALGRLAREFRVELLPDQYLVPQPIVTLRPAGPIRARVFSRRPAA